MLSLNYISSQNNIKKISFKKDSEKSRLEEAFRQAKMLYLNAEKYNCITPSIENRYNTSLEQLIQYYIEHNCLNNIIAHNLKNLKNYPLMQQTAEENSISLMYLTLKNNYDPTYTVPIFMNTIYIKKMIDILRELYGKKDSTRNQFYWNHQDWFIPLNSSIDETKIKSPKPQKAESESAENLLNTEKAEEFIAILKQFFFSKKDREILLLRFGPQEKKLKEIAESRGCCESNISLLISAYIKAIRKRCEKSPELKERLLEYCNGK